MRGVHADGIEIRTGIILGKAAEEFATDAEENQVDLIVMATHGHSGLGRVAERILGSACEPRSVPGI